MTIINHHKRSQTRQAVSTSVPVILLVVLGFLSFNPFLHIIRNTETHRSSQLFLFSGAHKFKTMFAWRCFSHFSGWLLKFWNVYFILTRHRFFTSQKIKLIFLPMCCLVKVSLAFLKMSSQGICRDLHNYYNLPNAVREICDCPLAKIKICIVNKSKCGQNSIPKQMKP